MRARLLDATIALLVERGWADMSTNDVVHRAHVSRGALTHHFPSKAALMDAAADRLISQRAAEFTVTFRGLPAEQRTVDGALDLLWSYFQGPAFAALLELIVAARTNRDLRTALADAPVKLAEEAYQIFVDLFPEAAGGPIGEMGLRFALVVMTGLAVQEILERGAHGRSAETLAMIKALAATFLVGGDADVVAGAAEALRAGELLRARDARADVERLRPPVAEAG
jgi:AcrR family transcriptional regulator